MNTDKLNGLSEEQKLLILSGRVTFSSEEKDEIKKIIQAGDINWFEFLKLAAYHKMIALCWKNICVIYPKIKIPKYLNDVCSYVYKSTELRNMENLKQVKLVVDRCREEGITCIPVKGVWLIEQIYHDYGVRYTGDMDFLIKHSDVLELDRILTSQGYVQGNYNNESGMVEPMTR